MTFDTSMSSASFERALDFHVGSIVIDGLDVSSMNEKHFLRMQEGGVAAANCTVTVYHNFQETVELLYAFQKQFDQLSYLIRPIHTVEDIHAAKHEGRVGVIHGFQNTSPIESDVRLLSAFKDMGVRIVQLTYMTGNLSGDGCLEPRNAGLTYYGKSVIREMNRLGLLIDLSHCGDQTSLEAIRESQQPVAFTHACARSLANNPRNKTDELIQALAATGGVMGITSLARFVSDDEGEADLNRYLDHIDYVAKLVGIDHVGLAMDFTEFQPPDLLRPVKWGGSQVPNDVTSFATSWPIKYATDIDDPTKFPNVTHGLLSRGYSESDVRKILGGNFLRLFEEVWQS